MPSSGGTTGTPITPGTGVGLSIAQPLPYTLLSLGRYAKVLGINPAHFSGATAIDVFPVSRNACQDLWTRYSWQCADRVSHEDLARAILEAEQQIASYLGWWPAPTWIEEEVLQFSRHHRRDVWRTGGVNVRGQRISLKVGYAKVDLGGRRAVDKIDTATTAGASLQYTDEDGDGFAETAKVIVNTTYTDPRYVKVFFTNTGGVQEWEIRPVRGKTISGGVFTGIFDSWLFIDPDVLSAYPTTAGWQGIDISTPANFVTSVDVYYEYTDDTIASAEFYWEPQPRGANILSSCELCGGAGCPACEYTTQDGCLHVRDAERGFVVPQPGVYSADTTEWSQDCYVECRDPDFVKVWYLAGLYDKNFLRGVSYDPLSDYWAQTIAMFATTKLERPFCTCGNVTALAKLWRTDLAFTGTDTAHQVSPSMLENPLGTLYGQVETWRRISELTTRVDGGAI